MNLANPSPRPRNLAVVGGGMLGALTALAASDRGWSVTLFEQAVELWQGASWANEGKIHLGLVYARAEDSTIRVMTRGALTFADLVDRFIGRGLPWDDLSTEPFDYVIPPTSALDASQMLSHARRVEATLRAHGDGAYLGRPVRDLPPTVRVQHQPSGLPALRTAERAVDPWRLREVVLGEIARRGSIIVRTDTEVTGLHPIGRGVRVDLVDGDRIDFDAVVNAAGWSQETLRGPRARERNYRIKLAAILSSAVPGAPVTLVHGAFGDVVPYPQSGRSYVSWYPIARLTNEVAVAPSEETRQLLASVSDMSSNGRQQVAALTALGVLTPDVVIERMVGGLIIADGRSDVDSPRSALHHRSRFGVQAEGRIVTPVALKLTTVPAAAELAVAALDRITS